MNKYLIAILPPDPIAGEIYKFKEYFRDKYNSKGSLNSPAHITMHMPFEWKEERQSELVDLFLLSKTPFEIELDGFGSFPPRVIFINVRKNSALENLEKEVVRLAKTQLNLLNARYRDEPFHPHLTVAFRDLKKPAFKEAWDEFKAKSYNASFECTKLSLLKHDGRFWREFS